MKVSVMDLVFDAPRLLEWLGWSITKRPHLLGAHRQHAFPVDPCLGLGICELLSMAVGAVCPP